MTRSRCIAAGLRIRWIACRYGATLVEACFIRRTCRQWHISGKRLKKLRRAPIANPSCCRVAVCERCLSRRITSKGLPISQRCPNGSTVRPILHPYSLCTRHFALVEGLAFPTVGSLVAVFTGAGPTYHLQGAPPKRFLLGWVWAIVTATKTSIGSPNQTTAPIFVRVFCGKGAARDSQCGTGSAACPLFS